MSKKKASVIGVVGQERFYLKGDSTKVKTILA